MTANGMKNKYILELVVVIIAQAYNNKKVHWIAYFKRMNLMVGELHLKKKRERERKVIFH